MSSALNTASGLPDLGFETVSPLRAALKSLVIQPFANYCPAPLLRGLLRITESRLAQSNWEDPGGWRSMVISYDRQCTQVADRVLVSAGTMPMALRNRPRATRSVASSTEIGALLRSSIKNRSPRSSITTTG